jgi:hypothetical protein
MVIDIHMEANSTTLSELADLAAYNRNTKIIWDHCGWSNTGEATASTIRTFLSENSNVYLSLKLRALENNEMRKASPFDERGRLRKEWKELFKDYADRIMVGIDNKYYSDSKSVSSTMKLTMTYYAELMSELPSDVATAVSNKTAKTLFGITD